MSKDTVVLATRVSKEIHDIWKFFADSLDEKPSQLLGRVVKHITQQDEWLIEKFKRSIAMVWLARQWQIPVEIPDLFIDFPWDEIYDSVGKKKVREVLRTAATSKWKEASQLIRRSRRSSKVVLGTRVPSASAGTWKEVAHSLNMTPSQLLALSVEYIVGCGDWQQEYFDKGAALIWLGFQWGVCAEVPELADQPWNDFQYAEKTPPNVELVREAVRLSPTLALEETEDEAEEAITSDCVGTIPCSVCAEGLLVYQGRGNPQGFYWNCKNCESLVFVDGEKGKELVKKRLKPLSPFESKNDVRKRRSGEKDRRSK